MIGCHVVGYCVAISHCLLDDEIGVPVDYEASAPHVLAMRMPWRSASYSASLLEAWLKLIWRMYFSFVPLGEMSTTPAPAPCCLLDPSKNIDHEFDRSGVPGV